MIVQVTTNFIDALRERIEQLEKEVAALKPQSCVYEARPYTNPYGAVVMGAWCRTHGWHCPAQRLTL
jgi:hypothetical protein